MRNQPYERAGKPAPLNLERITALLSAGSLFAGNVLLEQTVDSTNTRLKALSAQGAKAGTALLAEEQTGGRGTHGRAFQSPRGEGLYLSALLRPQVALEELLPITGWVAVAAREALEAVSGAPCRIKWMNDLYLHGRKVVGILTEVTHNPEGVVVGVGVNVSQSPETFRAQGLEGLAGSLAGEGFPADRDRLAAAVLNALDRLNRAFPHARQTYLEAYREHCLTLGQEVVFQASGQTMTGIAAAVDEAFALLVDGADGERRRVFSGSVSLKHAPGDRNRYQNG